VTVVAAVGYVTARAVDIHSDDIYLPPQFLFVYVILFTLALGVFWEVLEFAVRVGADVLGFDPVLIQYGLSDSLLDLVFNTVGAVVIGLFAAGLFSGVVDSLVERLDTGWPSPTDEWRGEKLEPARIPLGDVLTPSSSNARRAWTLTGGLFLVAAIAIVDGNVLWATVATTTVALVVIPALAYRTPRVMPPWELLVLVVLPVAARLIAPDGVLASVTTYGAVAAIALLVAVELHQFTTVEMTPWFAILTVVVTTMAAAGIWAVGRWVLDLYFGTQFLLVPTLTDSQIEDGVMWDFVYSTLAGVAAGLLFEHEFRTAKSGENSRRSRDTPR